MSNMQFRPAALPSAPNRRFVLSAELWAADEPPAQARWGVVSALPTLGRKVGKRTEAWAQVQPAVSQWATQQRETSLLGHLLQALRRSP